MLLVEIHWPIGVISEKNVRNDLWGKIKGVIYSWTKQWLSELTVEAFTAEQHRTREEPVRPVRLAPAAEAWKAESDRNEINEGNGPNYE